MKLDRCSGDRCSQLFVGVLVAAFAAGSWLAVNALWVELPVLVALGIPEGYTLASYLVIIIQLANIGPAVFTIANHFIRGNRLEVPTIYATLIAAVLACLLLIFFWDATTYWPVFGDDRSTALLCLSFILSLVNCTSNVTFIPFMVRFKPTYLNVYFIGQGFSALIPSLAAIGQGVSKEVCVANYTYVDEETGANCTAWMSHRDPANFSPEIYYLILTICMGFTLLAFIFLNMLPLAKKEYVQVPQKVPSSDYAERPNVELEENGKNDDFDVYHDKVDKQLKQTDDTSATTTLNVKRSRGQYAFLFIVVGVANSLGNSILPSIQTYSCGAYGFTAFLMSATLSKVANPIACFIVMFFPSRSLVTVSVSSILCLVAGGYCLMTAVLSPSPPLQGQTAGTVLVVLAWFFFGGIFAYIKAVIGWIFRNEPDNHKLLLWYGVVTQIGSLLGALVMFPLVTFVDLFEPYYADACSGFPVCSEPVGTFVDVGVTTTYTSLILTPDV